MLLSRHTRRREFIAGLGGAAAWPMVARAQQPTMPVIGYLDSGSPEASRGTLPSLYQGLADAGYIAGKTITIEARWANGQVEQLPALAKELVNRRVDIIIAAGAVGSARAAEAATSTIPVVIAGGADPVRYGLVDSLARPGGNITGVTTIYSELASKRLDLMHDLVPGAAAVGYLTSDLRGEIAREDASDVVAAARTLGQRVIVLECRRIEDLETDFATLVQGGAGALVVQAFATIFNNRDKLLALAAQHKIPAIYPQLQYVHGGGLMSYGAATTLRDVAVQYVVPILKGAKPADLPIQQPTKFWLAINLKTARALGLDVPPSVLARADEVIE
jgi:putative ABC transport system substrate-binding protein